MQIIAIILSVLNKILDFWNTYISKYSLAIVLALVGMLFIKTAQVDSLNKSVVTLRKANYTNEVVLKQQYGLIKSNNATINDLHVSTELLKASLAAANDNISSIDKKSRVVIQTIHDTKVDPTCPGATKYLVEESRRLVNDWNNK